MGGPTWFLSLYIIEPYYRSLIESFKGTRGTKRTDNCGFLSLSALVLRRALQLKGRGVESVAGRGHLLEKFYRVL